MKTTITKEKLKEAKLIVEGLRRHFPHFCKQLAEMVKITNKATNDLKKRKQ